jgi:SET domain-containing protein
MPKVKSKPKHRRQEYKITTEPLKDVSNNKASFEKNYMDHVFETEKTVLDMPCLKQQVILPNDSSSMIPAWFDQKVASWDTCECQYPMSSENACKKTASLYPYLCDEHAIEKYNLSVRKSSIPNTNMGGLFAETDFKKGDFLCIYHGKLISFNDQTCKSLDYVLELPSVHCEKGYAVDSSSTQSSLGRWANDGSMCEPKIEPNAEFKILLQKEVNHMCLVYLSAKNDIKKGEEILVSYGEKYW